MPAVARIAAAVAGITPAPVNGNFAIRQAAVAWVYLYDRTEALKAYLCTLAIGIAQAFDAAAAREAQCRCECKARAPKR
jgi:hypothetical protein